MKSRALMFAIVLAIGTVALAAGILLRANGSMTLLVRSITHRAPNLRIVTTTPAAKTVADANTDFSFRLLHKLTAATPGKNVFFSPYGITNAMSIAMNGARGQTQPEIEKSLGLGSTDIADVNLGNRILLPSLENPDPQVQLDVANALWTGGPLPSTFQNTCQTDYDAGATTLNLPSAAPTINKWVSDHTEGQIDQIVIPDDLSEATLVITNAVYFHGTWQTKFDPMATASRPFTLDNGTTKSVPLMYEETTLPYLDGPTFQAVSVTYGSGRMSLYIALPKSGAKLADVVDKLNASTWAKTTSTMRPTDVNLYLPRFKAEFQATMNKPLIGLGMRTAFTPAADFSSMGHGFLH